MVKTFNKQWGIPFLLGLLLVGTPAIAMFKSTTFPELLGLSDLIVVGQIERVSEFDFTLNILEVVKGKWDKPTIKVRRFSNWTCAQRYAPYSKNQQALFYLRRLTWKSQNYWVAMGAGNEGEWELYEGDFIDRTWASRELFGPGFHEKFNTLRFWYRKWRGAEESELSRIISVKFPKESMIDAIKSHQQCFQISISSGQDRQINGITIICPESKLAAYKSKSDTHRFIVKDLIRLRDRLLKEAIVITK